MLRFLSHLPISHLLAPRAIPRFLAAAGLPNHVRGLVSVRHRRADNAPDCTNGQDQVCSRTTSSHPGPGRALEWREHRPGSTPGEDWAPPGSSAQDTPHEMTTNPRSIPDRSSPGSTRTAPPAAHQGLSSEKCATDGKSRIRARDKTVIGTWNVRTLRTAGRIEQLEHEMTRYNWQVLGLCEVRMKQFGESRTQEGHKFFFSGREDKHQEGIGFLVNKEIVNCVISCQPISSRIMTLRLNATPLNITIIQAYAPTSDYDDDFVDQFYEQIQEVLDKVPKKDYLIVQGDWNAKIGQDAHRDWKGICGACTNAETNERGTRLLEFASSNDLCIANTFGSHKDSRRWTWHHPDSEHHSQIDYILVKRRHKSDINVSQTRSFPGADIGSDHDLVMMSFKMRLKRMKKEGNVRMKFDLDKLQDPNIAEVFRAKKGGKFAPLLVSGH